jgi:hypothetical protein
MVYPSSYLLHGTQTSAPEGSRGFISTFLFILKQQSGGRQTHFSNRWVHGPMGQLDHSLRRSGGVLSKSAGKLSKHLLPQTHPNSVPNCLFSHTDSNSYVASIVAMAPCSVITNRTVSRSMFAPYPSLALTGPIYAQRWAKIWTHHGLKGP